MDNTTTTASISSNNSSIIDPLLIKYATHLWDTLDRHMYIAHCRRDLCFNEEDTVNVELSPIEYDIVKQEWNYFETQLCQGLNVCWEHRRYGGWGIHATFIPNQMPKITNEFAQSRYKYLTLEVLNLRKIQSHERCAQIIEARRQEKLLKNKSTLQKHCCIIC